MFKKIILIALAVVVLAVGGVGYWQRDLIKSYILSSKMSKDEIKEKMVDNKKILEDAADLKIRDFTQEEKNEIESGSKSENEVIGKILSESEKKEDNESPKQPSIKNPVKEATTKYITEIYALQTEYTGKLEEMAKEVKSEYEKMAKEEEKLSEAKKKIARKYLSEIVGLERECDLRFKNIISQLDTELKNLNADTEIIKTIKKAYTEEKNLKRAYYMSYVS